jgi:hypothetical protein
MRNQIAEKPKSRMNRASSTVVFLEVPVTPEVAVGSKRARGGEEVAGKRSARGATVMTRW